MLLSLDDRIFGLDAQLLLNLAFQGIAIFLLFMAASYLLLDPVRKILNDRKERVMREQREALENREAAVRMREEYDGKLKEIDKVAEQILGDSRKKALQRENEIIMNAKEEAGRIIAGARQEAELEQRRVNDEVKQEIISVASLLSEKLVASSLDREQQDALIEQIDHPARRGVRGQQGKPHDSRLECGRLLQFCRQILRRNERIERVKKQLLVHPFRGYRYFRNSISEIPAAGGRLFHLHQLHAECCVIFRRAFTLPESDDAGTGFLIYDFCIFLHITLLTDCCKNKCWLPPSD